MDILEEQKHGPITMPNRVRLVEGNEEDTGDHEGTKCFDFCCRR